MLRIVTSFEPYMDFIRDLSEDPNYSDPMLSTPEQIRLNLQKSILKPDNLVLSVSRHGAVIGLFVFLVLPEEKYLEMIVGLSREDAAYREILDFLRMCYPAWQADFVFNPGNDLLKEMLLRKNADFCPEQQKMVLSAYRPPMDTDGIESLSERRLSQYCAMHTKDVYWTGEKASAAPERFSIYLAVADEEVVGYIDVTNCYEENEIYDLYVRESDRRRGWGRKLLSKVIENNGTRGLMLLVDADNQPAISLYESMRFIKVKGQNNLTATWIVK